MTGKILKGTQILGLMSFLKITSPTVSWFGLAFVTCPPELLPTQKG